MLAIAVAGTAAGAEPGLAVLHAETRELPLREQLEEVRDDSGQLRLEDMARDAVVFRPVDPGGVNHGYSGVAYWYRVTLRNEGGTDANTDWVLELSYTPLDHVDFYIRRGDEVTHVPTGDQAPISEAQLDYHEYAVPVRIAGGESVDLYLRVQTEGSHLVPLTLWAQRDFHAAAVHENLAYGVFFGVMLVMAAYNLLILLFVRDRAYAYYIGTLLFYTLFQFVLSGYMYQYAQSLLAGAYHLNNRALVVVGALMLVFFLLFAREFLQTRVHTPRTHRFLNAVTALVLAHFAASFLIPYRFGIAGVALLGALSCMAFLAAGIVALRAKVVQARLYLVAWAVFVFGILIKVLEAFGLLPPTALTAHSWQVGGLFTVTLLSLALADRINIERKEKIAAQGEALRAREQAIDSLARYQRIVEAVPEGIFDTDSDGRILSANPAMATMLGYTDLDEMRAAIRDFRRDPVHDPEAAEALITRLRAEGRLTGYEVQLRRRNGTVFWAALSIRRIVDDAGKATAQGIVQDITERLEREDHTRARAAAEAATSAKSDFLAKMSHELRTPMNAIIGFADLALRSGSDARRLEHLGNIRAASRTLLRIIDDILDLSKIEAGKLTLERRDFYLEAVLEQVAMLLSQEAAAKGLALRIAHAPGTPLALVGDPLRLEQVLVNLVGNAVKFTERGEVELTVELASRTEQHARLRFMVRDTGIGLTAEEQSRLFSPFSQADAFSTRRRGGTGLGLAISKQLVERMGGRIAVESQAGVGSVFLFTAEFGLGNERAARPPVPAPAREPAAAPTPAPPARTAVLRGARVLLVEDNALNRLLAQEILQPAGLVLDMAESGPDAIAAVRQFTYSAVLMDVQMPGMDGLEATRRIRALPGGAALPIIALTANAMERDRQDCLAAGMSDFLSKPVDADQVLQVLAHWVGGAVAPLAPARTRTGFTGPQAVATPPPTLPALLPGIDVGSAVRRLGGRENLLLDVLHAMLRQYGGTPALVREHLQAGRIDDARIAAHTLKGLAATTGCARLAAAAREVEAALKGGAPSIEAPLSEMSAAFDEVRASAARLPAAAARPRARSALADVPAELERLGRLLRTSDSAAQEQFELLRPVLAQRLTPAAFEHLSRAMQVFDFDEAAAVLATLPGDDPEPREAQPGA